MGCAMPKKEHVCVFFTTCFFFIVDLRDFRIPSCQVRTVNYLLGGGVEPPKGKKKSSPRYIHRTGSIDFHAKCGYCSWWLVSTCCSLFEILDHFPKDRGENFQNIETTTQMFS